MTRDKILKDLAKQQEIEGLTPDISLLLKLVELPMMASEWRALVVCSRQVTPDGIPRFWYPSALLRNVMALKP